MKTDLKVGDKVKVIIDKPLSKTGIGPEIKVGDEHIVQGILTTGSEENPNHHIDIGLKSKLDYVTCLETGIILKDGHIKHWCHPSRFEKI